MNLEGSGDIITEESTIHGESKIEEVTEEGRRPELLKK